MSDVDVRALLRQGDVRLREGDPLGALAAYMTAAGSYEAKGECLKAVALFRQVRVIIAKHAPHERALDDEARARLPALYRVLGLEEEALAVEHERPDSA